MHVPAELAAPIHASQRIQDPRTSPRQSLNVHAPPSSSDPSMQAWPPFGLPNAPMQA